MTAPAPGALARGVVGHRGGPGATAAASGRAGSEPVIVLGYPNSGATRVLSLLSDRGGLACTSGTGVLPLCHQAAEVWRHAEARTEEPGRISALAGASIRAMAGAVITQILVGEGRDRWCEFAVASEDAAGTFLSLYPAARFVCVHRGFSDVARAAIQASPWGLAGPGYAPFLAAHPGSTLSALGAFWVARTTALLSFETGHPAQCLRIRYEDIDGRPGTAATIASFLGLSEAASRPGLEAERVSRAEAAPEPADPAPEQHLPVAQLPPALLAEVDDLLERLDYPRLSAAR
jgi:Sulfotransferase family